MASLPIPPHHDDLLIQHLRSFFGQLDDAAIDLIRSRLRWMQLPGGDTLMRQGEAGDALYLLVSGRLRVYIEEDGGRRMIREVPRGEVVGEMSLYTDAPRSATLVAIRDSVLVSLGKEDFQRLQAANPQISLAMTRQIVQRLQSEKLRTVRDRPVTMALLPITAGIDVAGFARDLALQLAAKGRVARVDAAAANAQLKSQHMTIEMDDGRVRRAVTLMLDEIESAHDHVLLVGDATPSGWSELCTRHADEILLLADAKATPLIHPIEQAFLLDRPPRSEAAEILVLLHDAGTPFPRHTADWLDRRPLAGHVHVRPALERDMARLARIQSRTAVGLVLGGGGARGFAHLGVYRALREQGIEVDFVGGTSSGAVMAALVATGLPCERIEQVARGAFGANPTGDYTLMPLLSLSKGRRLRTIVEKAAAATVGPEARIEDLWLRFFCIASNYSTAREVSFERGPIVQALLASSAIPGVLPPVLHDGELLCDGGTFNNFPVDVMRAQRGVGTVIGVDLSNTKRRRIELAELPSGWQLLFDRIRPRSLRRYRLPGMASIMMNSTTLYSASRQRAAREQSDLYFNPPLDGVGMLDWKQFEPIVEKGYVHAREVLAKATGKATG